MAFLPNIPAATDIKSQSQADLQANFQAINTLVNVNHVTFNGPDQGKHKVVTMPVQGAAPTFNAGENGFYNLLNATTAQNELYVQHQLQAGETATPFTASKMSNTAVAGCVDGWAYLPSGLLIKWGVTIAAEAGVVVAINPTAVAGGPVFTQAFKVFMSGGQVGGAAPVAFVCGINTALAANGTFTAYYSRPSNAKQTVINWLVIGV